VLRRPPFGSKHIKGGHDMGREFRVLSLLKAAGYAKIPAPIVYCEDEKCIGLFFLCNGKSAGRNFTLILRLKWD
jgi:aminoglycoside phosphotransferase (APT) family kinase protein